MEKTTKELDGILTREFLTTNYSNKEITMEELGKIVGCNIETIRNRLKKHNIIVRSRGSNRNKLNKILTREFLVENYTNRIIPMYKLGKMVGCDGSTIRDRLIGYNIPIRGIKGNNSHFWKGGISPLGNCIYVLSESTFWIKSVFQRDHYTCQECGQVGGDLAAHHIKEFSLILQEFLQHYPQLDPMKDKEQLVELSKSYTPFWDINNGKTLCRECHKLTYKYTKKK